MLGKISSQNSYLQRFKATEKAKLVVKKDASIPHYLKPTVNSIRKQYGTSEYQAGEFSPENYTVKTIPPRTKQVPSTPPGEDLSDSLLSSVSIPSSRSADGSDHEETTRPEDFRVHQMPLFSDKLYGLHEYRKQVADQIARRIGDDLITIDEYNKLIGASTPGANPLSLEGQSERFPTVAEFLSFLNTENVMNKSGPSFWESEDRENNRTRRACKLGIKFCVERDIKVYFVLNGLDEEKMRNAIDKFPAGSYTNSELRYIFRNKDNPQFQENVQFYRNGSLVEAPWVSDPVLWAQYNPKNPLPGFIRL